VNESRTLGFMGVRGVLAWEEVYEGVLATRVGALGLKARVDEGWWWEENEGFGWCSDTRRSRRHREDVASRQMFHADSMAFRPFTAPCWIGHGRPNSFNDDFKSGEGPKGISPGDIGGVGGLMIVLWFNSLREGDRNGTDSMLKLSSSGVSVSTANFHCSVNIGLE